MSDQHCLVGKAITSIELAKDKKAIRFTTDGGGIIARARGDCCSETWVESIEISTREFPATVLSVDDIEMPNHGSPSYYEVIAYYGCKIVTDKGHIIIDYRNSSNGYYGGDLSWPDDNYYYGGVFGQNESKEEWMPL